MSDWHLPAWLVELIREHFWAGAGVALLVLTFWSWGSLGDGRER